MTRDWLLTLLVTSPFLLAAVIAILPLTRKPAAIGQDRPATKLSAPRQHDPENARGNGALPARHFPPRLAHRPGTTVAGRG